MFQSSTRLSRGLAGSLRGRSSTSDLGRPSPPSTTSLQAFGFRARRPNSLRSLLDVKDIGYVINYDMPNQIEDYIHRIGRTGRAGKTGTAYSYFTPDQSSALPPPSFRNDLSLTIPFRRARTRHGQDSHGCQAGRSSSAPGADHVRRWRRRRYVSFLVFRARLALMFSF